MRSLPPGQGARLNSCSDAYGENFWWRLQKAADAVAVTSAVAVAVAVAIDVDVAVDVDVVFAFAVAVQLPVERAVTAMPEADKVRRLFERSAA
jgi:hypothetical protein